VHIPVWRRRHRRRGPGASGTPPVSAAPHWLAALHPSARRPARGPGHPAQEPSRADREHAADRYV